MRKLTHVELHSLHRLYPDGVGCPPPAFTCAARRHPLASFFILTFLFSSGLRIPTIFLTNWPPPVSFLAMFGPAFAALAVLIVTGKQRQAALLFRSLFQWKVNPGWYVAAILLVWDEEMGWRGFALPRLQAQMHPFAASAVLGLIWGVWHLPNFFIPGSSQEFIPIPVYLLYVFAHTFLYSWIFNGSRASLLLVCLHHASTNAFTVAMAALPAFATLIARPATLLSGVTITMVAILILTRATLLAEHRWGNPPQQSYQSNSGSQIKD